VANAGLNGTDRAGFNRVMALPLNDTYEPISYRTDAALPLLALVDRGPSVCW
jgi:hypothetical protein